MRSKAHWGYDADFLRQAAPALAITKAMIGDGFVLVPEDHDGNLLGVAAVQPMQAEGAFDLSRLFVEPSAIRTGIGRTLFDAAVSLARREGGSCLAVLSDPSPKPSMSISAQQEWAMPPSDAIPGRRLPLLEYRIPVV
jgi:GNAT superfamily N-acetyltransferase